MRGLLFILFIIFFLILFFSCTPFRYTLFHIFQVSYNAIRDFFLYLKYHKWNEFKGYGKMTMYIANDKQPFGSGKTLNLVRYTKSVYDNYNGKLVWSKKLGEFVPQEIKIYSNFKLVGIPYIPLTSEQQIINVSDAESNDYTVHLFLLDEMGSQFNNRNWKNNLSEDLLNAVLQQRKNKIAILGTVQDYSLFDATLRKVTTNVYECSKYWRFLICKEYYARDIERAQNNTELITVRDKFCKFATDKLYNSYDTSEKVSKMHKEVQGGLMLTNEEILQHANGDTPELGSLTHVRSKFRKRVKK